MITRKEPLLRAVLRSFGLAAALGLAGCAWASASYVDDSLSASGNGKASETAFKTIQKAIDSAEHGDTVRILEGICPENIH